MTAALGGRWHGRYGLTCCPAHADRNPSMTLADGSNGQLLLHCKAGCAFRDIVAALRRRGLLDARDRLPPPDPHEIVRRHAADEAAAAKRERQAQAIWTEAVPVTGTPAEAYLRGRGITGDLPKTLRYHPECWHGATASRMPAIVARVDGLERLAVHRTYLRLDGRGKADVAPNKAMLGRVAGGAVRLAHGAGPLVVAEGIETALSLACGLLRSPAIVWAALSAGGMARLCLPHPPHELLIAADGDDAGCAAAEALGKRAASLRWVVRLRTAPDGRDFNDVLRARRGC
ncbi:toprim domain-containing protein [Paracoccus sp. S-4012]|uniref:DUF7146 domain-containing protein n=1 Tax=Paracoccus sp. S-4012 TaxID=2665648 RepID=UPI001E6005C9|nr:toprim domain-containing protein [Paracoccus sp. S-4012]